MIGANDDTHSDEYLILSKAQGKNFLFVPIRQNLIIISNSKFITYFFHFKCMDYFQVNIYRQNINILIGTFYTSITCLCKYDI